LFVCVLENRSQVRISLLILNFAILCNTITFPLQYHVPLSCFLEKSLWCADSWERKLKEIVAIGKLSYSYSRFECDFQFFSNKKERKKIKPLLYSFNILTGERCPSPRLCARAHTSRLQRWRVGGNVWEIWSALDLHPVPPVPEAAIFIIQAEPFIWASIIIIEVVNAFHSRMLKYICSWKSYIACVHDQNKGGFFQANPVF